MFSRKTTVSAAALLLASAGAAAAFPATATTDLNVRSGPGTGYSVVDQLNAGDSVEVVATSGSWYQLADGGWASGAFLDAEGSAAIEGPSYVVESYPRYYGTPAFYYGSDPYFWDDDGYYWYWRAGRRHRVGWDFFRDRDHDNFRWSSDRYRRDFEGRRDRFAGGDRFDGDRARIGARAEVEDDRFDGDRFDGDRSTRIGARAEGEGSFQGERRLQRGFDEESGRPMKRVERSEGEGGVRTGRASADIDRGEGQLAPRRQMPQQRGGEAEGGEAGNEQLFRPGQGGGRD